MSSLIVRSKLRILVVTSPLLKIIIWKCWKSVSKEIECHTRDLLDVCLTSSFERLAVWVNFFLSVKDFKDVHAE